MPQCFVLNCGNYYGKTRGNVIYHMIPTTETLRNKWIELCRGKFAKCTSYARICSEHFSSACYQRDLQHELLGLPLRRKLKRDALPDRNLPKFGRKKKSSIDEDLSIDNDLLINDNRKIPMRSSIRIAKKKSLELLSNDLNFHTKSSYKGDRENFTEKIKFLRTLNLKFCKNDFIANSNHVIVSLTTCELELAKGTQDFNYKNLTSNGFNVKK